MQFKINIVKRSQRGDANRVFKINIGEKWLTVYVNEWQTFTVLATQYLKSKNGDSNSNRIKVNTQTSSEIDIFLNYELLCNKKIYIESINFQQEIVKVTLTLG